MGPGGHMEQQKREFFRLAYTKTDYAIFEWQSESGLVWLPIIDISASGLCYQMAKNQSLPAIDEEQVGSVVFQDKTRIRMAGVVLRINTTSRQVTLKLIDLIDLGVLMAQHRQMINKFKK